MWLVMQLYIYNISTVEVTEVTRRKINLINNNIIIAYT
jgi:hypothetical protein